jgi:hypothetical protein
LWDNGAALLLLRRGRVSALLWLQPSGVSVKLHLQIYSPHKPPVDKVVEVPEDTKIIEVLLSLWHDVDGFTVDTRLKIEYKK